VIFESPLLEDLGADTEESVAYRGDFIYDFSKTIVGANANNGSAT
jgi:hypothetical protein